jgi:hypothetical protein
MGSCPSCDGNLAGISCKLRCTRCGYFESCSDLEPHPQKRPEPKAKHPPEATR